MGDADDEFGRVLQGPVSGEKSPYHCRLLEPIGSIPPAEAEANYYVALAQSDMAA